MKPGITTDDLLATGLPPDAARSLLDGIGEIPPDTPAPGVWTRISTELLAPHYPFETHRLLYDRVFADWDESTRPRPAWSPSPGEVASSNIRRMCESQGLDDYDALRAWSTGERIAFWGAVIEQLGIRFQKPPTSVADMSGGPENPVWLPGARMNAADSCFVAPDDATALVYQTDDEPMHSISIGELERQTARFANALAEHGVERGDAVAIAMPMTLEAVVAYIGIVRAGCAVVSVADSFAAHEIETRLRIAGARVAVTQDVVLRAGKTLPMYAKVVDAGAERAIVVPAATKMAVELRETDVAWSGFLSDNDAFETVACDPHDTCNVLFSSGTTGEPKAIPWSHTTAIKCAMDGHLHHDIKPGETVAWPTNIGWMMGPWLIFASLMNRASMALYYGAPNTRGFCEFVQNARVNMLGVVPSLVRAWRNGDLVDGLDWSAIDNFSSTGEASNADDMLWLMSRAGYRPVIEYCGGTEIGGGYVTQTMVQPASPSTFSTPALGLELFVLDEDGNPTDHGELFIEPPSMGLSLGLLNRDHHEVYYEGTPPGPDGQLLRRHGDQMEWLPGGYMRCQGRADDTMNLGGIKVSSAEIERAANRVDGVLETAAIAHDPPEGGPSRLVVYVVSDGDDLDPDDLKPRLQKAISGDLNPLFRVEDVVVIDALPRTASNKVMRRVLRNEYSK